MCFPSLAKPISGYYCRIWAWHIEPERDGERQHCFCKSLQREDEGSMSNPERCRVVHGGVLASGSTVTALMPFVGMSASRQHRTSPQRRD